MIGLEWVTVRSEPLRSSVEVVGEIAQETENVTHVTCPERGTLKSVLVKLGEVVEKGTPLCRVQTKAGTELEVTSPGHGIVLAQYSKEGELVDTLTSVMTIANPDLLRASFNVYEKDLAGIKVGQKVIVKSIAYPEREFDGEVIFISPSVDEKTRAVKIRVDVKNEEHLLKFGMFVTGEILVPISDEVLILPHNAIQSVEGKSVVFIPSIDAPDEFVMKEVQTGRKTATQMEIVGGVTGGEKVVGKGSFYLKSELLKGELEEGHAH
jgi:cobalt-zinc-cadmium efflux system membrane fusion protein